MLPSSGYFRSILCPHFESGACDRVYCHFRHKKKVETIAYIPTPISQLRRSFVSQASSSSSSVSSLPSSIPQYRPTPLKQLKQHLKDKPEESKIEENKGERKERGEKEEGEVEEEKQTKRVTKSAANGSKSEPKTSDLIVGNGTKCIAKQIDQSKESRPSSEPNLSAYSASDDDEDGAGRSSAEDSDLHLSSDDDKIQQTNKSKEDSSTNEPETGSLLNDIEKVAKRTKKQRKNLDKEIEQSIKKAKKNRTPGLLISEQEQVTNDLSKKGRVAHKVPDNANQIMSDMLSRKSMKLTPAQIMFNRFLTAQANTEDIQIVSEESTQVTSLTKVTSLSKSINLTDDASASKKKRVAHTIKPACDLKKVACIKKPTVFPEIGSKVPTNLRQKYLDLFIEECLKLNKKNRQQAYDRAMTEEKNVYRRSSNKNIYLNLAVNTVKRIRNESAAKSVNKIGQTDLFFLNLMVWNDLFCILTALYAI